MTPARFPSNAQVRDIKDALAGAANARTRTDAPARPTTRSAK